MIQRSISLAVAFLTAGLVAACGASSIGLRCEDVLGDVAGASVPVLDQAENVVGFTVDGAAVAGDLQGTGDAEFSVVRVDAEAGVMHLEGSHTFHDGDGAFLFRTADQGTTTFAGSVHNEMTLVEGGTGRLEASGTVDAQTGALTLQYSGRICR